LIESRGPSRAGAGRKAGVDGTVVAGLLNSGAVLLSNGAGLLKSGAELLSRGAELYTDLNAVLCSTGICGKSRSVSVFSIVTGEDKGLAIFPLYLGMGMCGVLFRNGNWRSGV